MAGPPSKQPRMDDPLLAEAVLGGESTGITQPQNEQITIRTRPINPADDNSSRNTSVRLHK